ncbi:hypothetical protein [Thalassolituus sp.]|uniref:hypothetical protein n=1 Tax=Thalassolituus sp. TaxID=2030822 RepID=UPI00355A7A2B
MHSIKSIVLMLFAATLLAACSSNPQRQVLTEIEYYEEAREAIDDDNMLIAEDRLKRQIGRASCRERVCLAV